MKKCVKCGNDKPRNAEYFCIRKNSKDGLRGACKECTRAETKIYREEHKELIKAHSNSYRGTHKQSLSQYSKIYNRSYRKKHKEKKAIYEKSYKREHKEELAAQAIRYRNEHKEEIKAYLEKHKERISTRFSIYAKANRDQMNAYKQARKAKERKLTHTLTREQWQEIKNNFDNKCAYCGKAKTLEQEHFYPVTLGGEYATSNIIPACKNCNSSKGAKLFKDWYPQQPYFNKSRENNILKYLGYKNNSQQLAMM